MRCRNNPDQQSHDRLHLSPPFSAGDCAATEAAENIIAFRCEVVAVARVTHFQRRRLAGTAQHEAAVEPRRRVVAVGVGAKSGVGQETARCPFPELAPFVAFLACVGTLAERALRIARGPVVLKPADMADFPLRRIQLWRKWYAQRRAEGLFIGGEQGQGALTGGLQGIDHIRSALAPLLGEAATATIAATASYRWLGGLPHAATRRRIQRADLLIHASSMEGGAHVVMEAVCSGTPVIASAIAGNIGMLGRDYAGYYNCGDAQGLAALLVQCRASQGQRDGLLARLAAQCRPRAALFAPAAERAALRRLVADLLVTARSDPLAAS